MLKNTWCPCPLTPPETILDIESIESHVDRLALLVAGGGDGEPQSKKLLEVLHTLVDQGNTVIVIEHNLEVVKTADWVIDIGPEGGNKGGEIVAQGTPEDIAGVKKSYTGQYLAPYLNLETKPQKTQKAS